MTEHPATPMSRRLDPLLLAAASVAWWTTPEGRIVEPQASWETFTGQDWPSCRDLDWLTQFHADDREAVATGLRRDPGADPALQLRGRLWSARHAAYRTVRIHALPVRDVGGRVAAWEVAAIDIEDSVALADSEQRRQAPAAATPHVDTAIRVALRDAHEAFRLLLEGSPFGLYVVDDGLRIAYATRHSQEGAFRNVRPLVGRELAEVMHVLWSDEVAREIVDRFRHVLDTGEPYSSPRFVHRRHDVDTTESYEWELHRARLPDGRWGVICHYFDSTELRTSEQALRRSEERARLLLREVNHRSKNLLSVVMTIARHTSDGGHGDFVERFDSRIRSLSINQDMLIRNEWAGVDLEELLLAHLQPFAEARDGRVCLAGPPLHLTSPLATQSLGMAIHELATNAAKYGALSTPAGHVYLDWEIVDGAGGSPRLSLGWRERGGPAVEAPARKGFGTIVLTSMLQYSLGAEVDLSCRPEGLEWSFRCPLGRVTRGDRVAVPGRPGRRRRVLVAEDEALLALEVKEALEASGFEVVGPVSSSEEALKRLAQGDCDMAVLDIRLEDGSSEPIARLLGERRKPFVVMSGYPLHHLPEVYNQGIARFAKPVPPSVLVRSLSRLDDEDFVLS